MKESSSSCVAMVEDGEEKDGSERVDWGLIAWNQCMCVQASQSERNLTSRELVTTVHVLYMSLKIFHRCRSLEV